MGWFKKKDASAAGASAVKAAAAPKDPKGLVKFGEQCAQAPSEPELRAWASRTWGDGTFTLCKSENGKLAVVLKNPEPPKPEELSSEQIVSLLQVSVGNRTQFEILAKQVAGLGKVAPQHWWARLQDELEDLDLGHDGPAVLVMAVLLQVGRETKGNKRSQIIVQFLQGVPAEHRTLAVHLAMGAYVGFYANKQAAAAAPPNGTAVSKDAVAAPPSTTAPTPAEGDDGSLKIAND